MIIVGHFYSSFIILCVCDRKLLHTLSPHWEAVGKRSVRYVDTEVGLKCIIHCQRAVQFVYGCVSWFCEAKL